MTRSLRQHPPEDAHPLGARIASHPEATSTPLRGRKRHSLEGLTCTEQLIVSRSRTTRQRSRSEDSPSARNMGSEICPEGLFSENSRLSKNIGVGPGVLPLRAPSYRHSLNRSPRDLSEVHVQATVAAPWYCAAATRGISLSFRASRNQLGASVAFTPPPSALAPRGAGPRRFCRNRSDHRNR
jgi:hypothetical protein